MYLSVLCLLCLCVRLFVCALWSPAGNRLTSWLSFVVSNCYSYTRVVHKRLPMVGEKAIFIKIISHYKKIGYNINVLQQTACLVVNPITVGNFAFLFNCTPVGRTLDSMMVPT